MRRAGRNIVQNSGWRVELRNSSEHIRKGIFWGVCYRAEHSEYSVVITASAPTVSDVAHHKNPDNERVQKFKSLVPGRVCGRTLQHK